MDLKELMRMGSLTMNLLQSDHFKQLMAMMGNMNSPFMGQWFANRPGQKDDQQRQQPNLNPGNRKNNVPFEYPWLPFQNLFGMQQKRSFPFSSDSLPPWMMQRPHAGNLPGAPRGNGIPFFEQMWKSINPLQSNMPPDPFHRNGSTAPATHTRKSQQNRIFIQDMDPTQKRRKRGGDKKPSKKH